jgi:type IV secretory pathway VirD2 relaxase
MRTAWRIMRWSRSGTGRIPRFFHAHLRCNALEHAMSGRDDDRFEPRAGKSRDSGQARIRAPKRFTAQVLRAANQARGGKAIGRAIRRGVKGRGRVAATILKGRANSYGRRVMVKTRLVNLRKAAAGSTARHVGYIERDGVTREGAAGQAYDRAADAADSKTFVERVEGDRHQFRFIVSAEDAEDIADLRRFTRDLMARMETDLGTRLDWIAVDHWDTDNPHSHVIVRGIDERGADLIIDGDYIAHGLRLRAGELATDWLGPVTERELRERMVREVDQERLTGLDRRLIAMQSREDSIRLSTGEDDETRFQRRQLGGRLQTLERLGLANRDSDGAWRLRDGTERILRDMGERGDIIRTMQRAFSDEVRAFEIFANGETVGRIARKGLADELEDRGYLIVDGIDGKARYVALPSDTDLATYPEGGVVRVRSVAAEPRSADRTIDALAGTARIYRPDMHLAVAQTETRGAFDPEAFVRAHVRRLEAMRRIGAAERLTDGTWRLPQDFLDHAAAHEAGRLGGVRVDLVSHLPVDRQMRTMGATWLDRSLLDGAEPATTGFGAQVREALDGRRAFLVKEGLAEYQGARFRLARNLLETLRHREIANVAKEITASTGLPYRPIGEGDQVEGTYRRSVQLASGRFAMLDDGMGFSLVPWRPVIEPKIGQTVSGVMRGGNISWDFGRSRGPAV